MLLLPTEEQQVKIREFLNENPGTRDQDVETIKKWLKNHPNLPDEWDDQCILSFLRGCKFSIEASKKKLEKYFTFRATLPEFFANRDIRRPEFKELIEIVDAACLPGLTPDGRRISIAKAAKQDFETPNLSDLFKVVFMIGDLRLKFEKFGVLYDVYILDMNFPLFKHFLRINPLVLKRFLTCVQDAYPVIVKEIHMVNAPAFIEFVINIIKPFMGEALRDSIHVHSGIETLYEFVPKSSLPEEYGGDAGKLTDMKKEWLDILEDYSSWFKSEEEIKADKNQKVLRDFNEKNCDFKENENNGIQNLCID